MTLSPDGKRVAYLSDTLRVGNELFVVDLGAAGPSSPRKLSAPFPSDTQRVRTLAWSPDSRYLAYTGDVATSGIIEALVVDTDVGAPGPVTVNPPLPLNRSLALTSKPLWSPDGTALFYSMMDYALEGQLGVYRTLLAHAGEADELSLPLGAGESAQNIDNIGVAADAVTYAVRSSAGTYSLHYVSLSGSTPAVVRVDAALPPGSDYRARTDQFFPDGSGLVFLGSTGGSGSDAYLVDVSGVSPGPPTRLNTARPANGSVDIVVVPPR